MNAQLECNAADERAKLLASEVISLEEKVIIFPSYSVFLASVRVDLKPLSLFYVMKNNILKTGLRCSYSFNMSILC